MILSDKWLFIIPVHRRSTKHCPPFVCPSVRPFVWMCAFVEYMGLSSYRIHSPAKDSKLKCGTVS